MALAAATVLFGLFVLNVILGALTGNQYLNDVSEMVVLFVASILFVAAILRREADAKKNNSEDAQ